MELGGPADHTGGRHLHGDRVVPSRGSGQAVPTLRLMWFRGSCSLANPDRWHPQPQRSFTASGDCRDRPGASQLVVGLGIPNIIRAFRAHRKSLFVLPRFPAQSLAPIQVLTQGADEEKAETARLVSDCAPAISATRPLDLAVAFHATRSTAKRAPPTER